MNVKYNFEAFWISKNDVEPYDSQKFLANKQRFLKLFDN